MVQRVPTTLSGSNELYESFFCAATVFSGHSFCASDAAVILHSEGQHGVISLALSPALRPQTRGQLCSHCPWLALQRGFCSHGAEPQCDRGGPQRACRTLRCPSRSAALRRHCHLAWAGENMPPVPILPGLAAAAAAPPRILAGKGAADRAPAKSRRKCYKKIFTEYIPAPSATAVS